MEFPSFSDIWDSIVDEFEYFISFEWFGDMFEFIAGMFENMSEFSIPGTLYGIVLVVLVYLFKNQVFVLVKSPFLQIPFYFVAFVMGYLAGKRIWE
jgi:hypothetical protein